MDEWDKTIAPILGAIHIRAGWVQRDVSQIKEWVDQIAVAPAFETMALDDLDQIQKALFDAGVTITATIKAFKEKEKIT